MSEGAVSEREFGQLEQQVKDLPTHGDLRTLTQDITRLLERHEAKTEKLIESTTTKTVEAAFKLQWSELEKHIAANKPPQRDWLPYVMAGGVILFAGIREAIPVLLRLFP